MVGFVNGIPLLFLELKSIHRDSHAYEDNLKDYKDTIPNLFINNAFIILSNGLQSKIGTITSSYKFFHEWKIHEEDVPNIDLTRMIKGTCDKKNFLDLFENFIVFEEVEDIIKVLAKNHQFLGVNKVINNIKTIDELSGKLGVFCILKEVAKVKCYSYQRKLQKIFWKLHYRYCT